MHDTSYMKFGMDEGKTAGDIFGDLARKRIYIETYGCRYNFGDTEKLKEVLNHYGCLLSETENDADAVIINTCTVVASTERRMLRRLSLFQDRNLYVTGCMPEVQMGAILAVCSPKFISHDAIQEQYREVGTVAPSPVGIVQIGQGCSGACTYCITRKARGPLTSVPLKEILSQIAAFEHAGAAEIQLTAQDTGAWGRDIGLTLPDLLNAIERLDGQFHVRVGMMNPATIHDILDDLIDTFAANKLFSFIHIPIQSGSDRILRMMGRGYESSDLKEIIAAFRRRYPAITIVTDIIVGFPGETEEDFQKSLDFIRALRFDKVNVTRFSRRPSTPAFYLDDIPGTVKKDRSRVMQKCAETISAEIHARFIGKHLPFIVTEQVRKGSVMARTGSYTGIVIGEELPVGSIGIAEIRQSGTYFLKGRKITCR